MDPVLEEKIIGSIEANRLVLIAGAGLSMALPSNLPSAYALAQKCWDKYQDMFPHPLPPELKSDLEGIARHFWDNTDFVRVFIDRLVPWEVFETEPNIAHDAVADFLASDVLQCVVSYNFDTMIETALKRLGGRGFQASVLAYDHPGGQPPYHPLLKVHGCCVRERCRTVWCVEQVAGDAEIKKRIEESTQWLKGNLMGKDVVIVGFWTDWNYLNEALSSCLVGIEPASVVLVNPMGPNDLEDKAKGLWAWAHNDQIQFYHERKPANEFLEELRQILGRNIIRRMLRSSLQTFRERLGRDFPNQPTVATDISSTDLYSLRRNMYGCTNREIVRRRNHEQFHELFGYYHLRLLEDGAVLKGTHYHYKGKRIRLINTAGQSLSAVKKRFANEIMEPMQPDTTICVGADDDNGVSNIIRLDGEPTMTRGGISGKWGTHTLLDSILGGHA